MNVLIRVRGVVLRLVQLHVKAPQQHQLARIAPIAVPGNVILVVTKDARALQNLPHVQVALMVVVKVVRHHVVVAVHRVALGHRNLLIVPLAQIHVAVVVQQIVLKIVVITVQEDVVRDVIMDVKIVVKTYAALHVMGLAQAVVWEHVKVLAVIIVNTLVLVLVQEGAVL